MHDSRDQCGSPQPDDAEARGRDIVALYPRICALARHAVRARRLPTEYAEDLAHETCLALLGGETRDAADVVRRLASAASQVRRRTRSRAQSLPQSVDPGRSTPRLCPFLRSMGCQSTDNRRFIELLHRLANRAAHEPGVLLPSQLRAYLLAYEDGRSVRVITRMLRISSERATVERLRRVSRRLDRVLVARLAHLVDVGGDELMRPWSTLQPVPPAQGERFAASSAQDEPYNTLLSIMELLARD